MSSTHFASNEGFPSMGETGQQKAPSNDERKGALSRNWDLGDAAINSASTKTDKLTLSPDYREGVENVNVRATEGEVGTADTHGSSKKAAGAALKGSCGENPAGFGRPLHDVMQPIPLSFIANKGRLSS